ncbi:UDP-N-acetylglucosamine 2-epimerase (non-hydrolyzing) [bacterium 3DAC]|jgi:UDP-N-acetylglucosamine 2-epimerase (non-hydrolysing)|nr:UDP-N-acetylglucosamine 2-epimerase (non-hydrolyzing) [Dictyoglomota bacterium]UZN23093.1 UDP-N-acetylglucosamine 2-epimerase (non-hydrolyzing) [bacterium 3DAC]
MKKILIVIGTRPEAIKMAPVYLELKEAEDLQPYILSTGQHIELLDEALSTFGLKADFRLDIMKEAQTLAYLTSALAEGLGRLYSEIAPDTVLVHGDTTTTLMGALMAFYMRIPVMHVEAGLRSDNRFEPFPEEINRRLVDQMADVLFPPTPMAKARIYEEKPEVVDIFTTGNTVVDALMWVKENKLEAIPLHKELKPKEYILLTAHRRENWGEPLRNIYKAVKHIVRETGLKVVYPVHPNPRVKNIAYDELGNVDGVILTEPMDYMSFLKHMSEARIVLSDSGGVQEEAPSFGVPVVLLRRVTERPEGVRTGHIVLAGTDTDTIVEKTLQMLNKKLPAYNPFGDGLAARRIADYIRYFLKLSTEKPDEWVISYE